MSGSDDVGVVNMWNGMGRRIKSEDTTLTKFTPQREFRELQTDIVRTHRTVVVLLAVIAGCQLLGLLS